MFLGATTHDENRAIMRIFEIKKNYEGEETPTPNFGGL
jgi:hypothetical protein